MKENILNAFAFYATLEGFITSSIIGIIGGVISVFLGVTFWYGGFIIATMINVIYVMLRWEHVESVGLIRRIQSALS